MLVVIPARGGSRRIPHKALKLLGGRPLLDWAIDRARASGCAYVVASEDTEILCHAVSQGVEVWRRDPPTATDDAPDYSWARLLPVRYPEHGTFAILRITSPFLGPEQIQAAHHHLMGGHYSSVRCVTATPCHPAKMWTIDEHGIGHPVMHGHRPDGTPYHSAPTQTLPQVYLQTAGLEVTTRDTLRMTLAGGKIGLYEVSGPAALDLNTLDDWARAEEMAKTWTR